MVLYSHVQPDDLNRENWEALANAVVEQAAKDYLHALKVLKGWSNAVLRGKKFSQAQKSRMRSYIFTITECELFFSKYASRYTKVDGQYIRNKLVEASGMNAELLNELIAKFYKEEDHGKASQGLASHGEAWRGEAG